MIVKIISSWSPALIICNLKCGSLSEHTFKFADKRLGSRDNRSTNAAIFSLLTGSFRRLHSVSTSSQSRSVSRYPSTLHIRPDTCTPSSLDWIIRIHQDSSSAERYRKKSQLCSNSHAAGAANANRDIGSWMQAWSQWLFCSWRGLCLIGIGHAEWSSEEGYGNAPAESIKWGDTLRPYDGQRINESQRKRGTEEYGLRWWNEHIFQENILCTQVCASVD